MIYSLLQPQISHCQRIPTLEGKINKFVEYLNKQNIYTKEYVLKLIDGMFRRVRIIAKYDLDNFEKLKIPITLIRPTEGALQDIVEDYCLSRLTTEKVVMQVIEGNHTTILDNPILPQLINDFHPIAQN